MIENLLNSSLFEIFTAMFIGLITVFLTKSFLYNIFEKKTGQKDPHRNMAFMIYLSGMIFSISYLVFIIFQPLSATLQILESQGLSGLELVLQYLKYLVVFTGMAYLMAALIVVIASTLFTTMTQNLDEFKEISDGNIGVAILMVVLTFVICLFTQHQLLVFLEGFIPYPELPNLGGV